MTHKFQSSNNALHNLMKQAKVRNDNLSSINTEITSIDNRLDTTISNINNLSNLGGGSDALKTASLGIMPSGNARILSCSTEGYLNVDLQSGTLNVGDVDVVSLPSLPAGSNSIGIVSLSDIDNSVLDASLVKHTNNETLLTQLDVVADNQLTKLTEIDVALDTLDGVLDASLVKQTNIETLITSTNSKIDTFDSVLDASLVKHTNIETLITTLDSVADNQLTKLTEIDAAIDTIDGVLDASLVKQTNIETLITSTNSKIDTLDSVLDASLVKHTNIETLITTLDSVADNQLTKLTEIDAAIDTIDGILDNILVQNTASEVHLSNIDSLSRTNISTGSSTLANSEEVGPIDCSKFSEICVAYLTSTATTDRKLFITGSTTSGGTYNIFAVMNLLSFVGDLTSGTVSGNMYGTGDSSQHAEFIPSVYPFIKIKNKTGIDLADVDDIRIIGR